MIFFMSNNDTGRQVNRCFQPRNCFYCFPNSSLLLVRLPFNVLWSWSHSERTFARDWCPSAAVSPTVAEQSRTKSPITHLRESPLFSTLAQLPSIMLGSTLCPHFQEQGSFFLY